MITDNFIRQSKIGWCRAVHASPIFRLRMPESVLRYYFMVPFFGSIITSASAAHNGLTHRH